MAHTLQDYTTKYKLSKIFSQVDVAELAARLGACSTLDRRGNLVWYDDFEAAAAVKWLITADGAGTGALSTDRSWMGNQSMKTVTDVAVGNDVTLFKSFRLPTERTLASELMFCITGGKPRIQINLIGYTGTNAFQGAVKYDHNVQKLYYYSSTPAWVELTRTDSVATIREPWFLMKLVVDWDTIKYKRFLFGGTTYDLSDIDMYSFEDTSDTCLLISIINQAETAAAATVYFDNFILTQNEP